MSFFTRCSIHRRHACPPYCPEILRVYNPDIPADFICPISHEVMVVPCIDEYGFTYSRPALIRWLQMEGRRHSPMTGEPYERTTWLNIRVNIFARSRIIAWWEEFYQSLPEWRESRTPSPPLPPCPTPPLPPRPTPRLTRSVRGQQVNESLGTASQLFASRIREEVARIEALLESVDMTYTPETDGSDS